MQDSQLPVAVPTFLFFFLNDVGLTIYVRVYFYINCFRCHKPCVAQFLHINLRTACSEQLHIVETTAIL